MPPCAIDQTRNENSSSRFLQRPKAAFFPSAMMMAQVIANSWFELLTLCWIPHAASESQGRPQLMPLPKRALLHRIIRISLSSSPCQVKKKRELTMDTVLHPLLVRVRSLRAFMAASLRKMLGMEAHDGD